MLRAHVPLINQAAGGLVRRLKRTHMAGAVQINNAMSGMTMEVIGGVAFGYVNVCTSTCSNLVSCCHLLLHVNACRCCLLLRPRHSHLAPACLHDAY